MIKYVSGDLIAMAKEGKFDVIGHGCNCFCNMGAGIAKTIKQEFPTAFKEDQSTKSGDRVKLGQFTHARCGDITVLNLYTQYKYGGRKANVDYEAIRSCMQEIKGWCGDKRIGLPLIGCGLAGGDWDIVERIINEELAGCDVTVVKFKLH
jgi:O-acetyl-ADP-ribose deacetylase (regulator of RNase III)